MECYRHSVVTHINSADHICSYTYEKQIIFFAALHIKFLCPYQKKSYALSVDNQQLGNFGSQLSF